MPDKKILLVDDDEDMLMLTSRWLTKAGYDVKCALSGQEALQMIGGGSFDLVLMDLSMPGMDGIETLRAIRSAEDTAAVPVMFLTGMDDDTAQADAGALNPAGYISKSGGKQKILDTLADYFA